MNAEYFEAMARAERSFAKERRQTVESQRVHIRNAEAYDKQAQQLRVQEANRTPR